MDQPPYESQAPSQVAVSVDALSPVRGGAELSKKPGIEPDDPMSEAGRKVLRHHFQLMLLHEPGTRLGEDIEALHDMRVATRRMRAAFRVFGSYYQRPTMAAYLKGLRRTGRALGAVRDLDVFRVMVWNYLDALPETHRDSMANFQAVFDDRRDAARQRMIAYLDSAKYRRFVEGFAGFVSTEGMGSRLTSPDSGAPRPHYVRHVAPVAIYTRLANVRAYDEWVSIPNPSLAQLHSLRISCKRLRYTLEFFREALGPKAKMLIKEIVTMQDHLGAVQDTVVASAILSEYVSSGTWGRGTGQMPSSEAKPLDAPGVEAYLAVIRSEQRVLLDRFPAAWQRLQAPDLSKMVAEAIMVL